MTHPQNPPPAGETTPSPALLSEREAATALTLAPTTLRNWRSLGIGIPYVKIGKRAVRYRRADVDAFLTQGAQQGRVS